MLFITVFFIQMFELFPSGSCQSQKLKVQFGVKAMGQVRESKTKSMRQIIHLSPSSGDKHQLPSS